MSLGETEYDVKIFMIFLAVTLYFKKEKIIINMQSIWFALIRCNPPALVIFVYKILRLPGFD